MDASDLELIARCASGFEPMLARELREMGIRRIRPLRGSVSFFGTQRDAYRACLWSRVATRVQLVLARVPAADAEELYASAVAFPWEKHVRDGATIAVRAHGTNPNLRNTQFTALKVKDALCDRLRQVRRVRPDVDAKHPDFSVDVALHEARATLSLNLSGESLHRRGYRQDGVQTEAPLKETLAAGILLAAGWDALARQGGVLVDPMCGSGTFAVEGALMAADIAPGILRTSWGFEGWVRHDRQLWDELRTEADARSGASQTGSFVIAGDLDAAAVEVAQENARRAGVDKLIRFHVDDAAHLGRYLRGTRGARGLLVANPPYGLRLLSQEDLPQVHEALSVAVDVLPKGWQAALITPDLSVDTALGRVPQEVIACHNGPIEAWVRLYDLDTGKPQTHEVISLTGERHIVRVADSTSAQFAGRLRKVAKERARWARREGITCYRVYDGDLPDYPVSVDFYECVGAEEGQRFIVVEERPRPRSVDVQRAGRHFADAVALAAAVLDVPSQDVVQKPWVSEGLYARTHDASDVQRPAHVSEAGYVFCTDLMGAPGKDLPLAQRELRTFVEQKARGARFANLFAAGDAATVFAVGAGARNTVTVDSSKERLDWTVQALRENNLANKQHRVACADVRSWLAREARAHHVFDLVLCSPPARLAARAGAQAWDAEKELPGLIRQLKGILSPEGMAVLVLPSQVTASAEQLGLEDVTSRMVPHDFERSRGQGNVYLLSKHS